MGIKGLWKKLGDSLKSLGEEMNRNSVANTGPSGAGCCHVSEEEVERRRQEARLAARQSSVERLTPSR